MANTGLTSQGSQGGDRAADGKAGAGVFTGEEQGLGRRPGPGA